MTGASCRVLVRLGSPPSAPPDVPAPRHRTAQSKRLRKSQRQPNAFLGVGRAPSAASSIVRPRRRTGLHDSAARRRRRAYLSLPGPGGEGSVRRHPGARRHVRLQASVEPRPMSSCVGWRDQSLPCVTAVVAARHQAWSNFSGQFSAASRAATPARARGACLGSGRGSAKR